jgi:hypothetical protein
MNWIPARSSNIEALAMIRRKRSSRLDLSKAESITISMFLKTSLMNFSTPNLLVSIFRSGSREYSNLKRKLRSAQNAGRR